jgi:manganese/zinc/iron transport system permease protein
LSPELVIILVGSFVATSCALVGSFLVLRKMALLGDAISHAVLPGIVIAFLLSGSRATIPMVAGAACLGVVTVFLVGVLNRTRRLKEDAAIGVVFPALFSIGVILISRYAGQIDLDLDCVLYGEIAYAPWDTLILAGRPVGSEALWVTGGVLLLNILMVGGLYKELKITSFDPELADTLGFSSTLLHYLLMAAVSVTVVSSFESVGAILVVAMLIVPPATAYLLTSRLSTLLVVAVAIGILSAVLGYEFAHAWDCSIAGAMAAVAGVCFVAALFLSPKQGLFARFLRHARLSSRLKGQLLMLHLREEGDACPPGELLERFGWSSRTLRLVLAPLLMEGWVKEEAEGFLLSDGGRRELDLVGTRPLAHR